jgi:hypothetical protein
VAKENESIENGVAAAYRRRNGGEIMSAALPASAGGNVKAIRQKLKAVEANISQ